MAVSRLRRIFRMLLVVSLVGVLSFALYYVWATYKTDDPRAQRVGPFLATPYLQLGDAPTPDNLTLLWHADDIPARWAVEVQSPVGVPWKATAEPSNRRIILDDVEPQRIYRSVMAPLIPGEPFLYRVLRNGAAVFEATARAKVAPGQPQRFVAFGDSSKNSDGQRKVAYQTHRLKPDMVLITGDIVYFQGRVGEYRPKFFPIYASKTASARSGAPLLSSTLFVGVPGNHDLMINDFARNADLMAYFYFWSQPLNGPIAGPNTTLRPPINGPEARLKAFRDAAGDNYPRMANFSFDYGDVHWLVLDANPYVRWVDADLRAWVANELASAKAKPWRFVSFHQPGFNSSKAHAAEQQMRTLADLFQAGGVSLVFSGHVHNYQRTYPLKFDPIIPADFKTEAPVDGKLTIDHAYDNTAGTRPDGVIYIVTGAGGADLYDADQTDAVSTWQPFTTKFVANIHSLTVVDVEPTKATVRQIDADGKELDRFVISGPPSPTHQKAP